MVTLIAKGEHFPHAVNTWNHYVRVEEHSLIIPMGGMQTMEKILATNQDILVTVGSYQVEGMHGQGAGFYLKGHATVCVEGQCYESIKSQFPWARGILKVEIETYQQTV